MERFFILDELNTWYDWRFILTDKTISPPDPKTNYVNIDGMNGTLDLSESLTGEITYDDRTISASFWSSEGSRSERERTLQEIIASLHGRKIKIIEPDDPAHYFYGRVKIKSYKNIIPYAEFSLEATCDPWRYAIDETSRYVAVNGDTASDVIIANNGVKTLCPLITVTGAITLSYGGASIELITGSYKISDIKLRRGNNPLSVFGNGSVTFTYREATL